MSTRENRTFRTKSITGSGKEVIVSANQFCATCFTELTISQTAVVASLSYDNGKSIEQSTMFTFANNCVSCCKRKLSSSTKAARKAFLVEACNEIAMAFYFELGERFATAQEVLQSNWLESYYDNFRRELGLTANYLPLEYSGKAGRKAYRKFNHRAVYQAIARNMLLQSREQTFADRKIQARINFLTSAIDNKDVSSDKLETLKKRRFFYADRQTQRSIMFS